MVFRCSINIPLVCALALSSGYVQAQDFDLDSAVAHALKNNPGLSAGRYQVGASAARTQASKARHLPTVTLSHTARLSDNPLDAFADKLNTRQVTSADFEPARLNHPGSSDLYFTELALRWPVYTGGRFSAMEKDAEHTERNARLQYQRERKQIAFNTMSAYLFVKATEQGLAIAEEAVAAARQHANTTARLAREGRIVESDKLAAAVNLAAVRSQREQAETRRRSAVDEFKWVTGLPMDSEISLAEENIAPVSGDVSVSENEKLALDNRKDLAAARAMVQAAQARVEAARSVRKPSVDVVLSSNWYDDNPGFESQSSSIMGVLSFDLYNGESSAEIDVTLAQQREMQWQLQSLELSVQKQVRDAYNRLLESRERLAIAEDNVKDAQRTVKLVQQRYGQGRTILLDLLQSEQLYTSARIEKLTARLNLNVARAELPLTTGTLMLPDMVSP
jgi:outer membrane protein